MVKFVVFCTKVIAAVLTAALFTSCHISGFHLGDGIEGDGNVITQTRNVDNNFDKVDVSRGLTVVLEQSENYAVEVEADENLQEHISTTVEDGTLIITADDNIQATAQTIYVKMPSLTSAKTASSSSLSTKNTFTGSEIDLRASSSSEIAIKLEFDTVNCRTSSSGSVDIRGMALTLNADSSSSSDINARNLTVNDVTAEASSSSTIEVRPAVKLSAKASSSASIDYFGSPKTVSKEESSSGSVSKQ